MGQITIISAEQQKLLDQFRKDTGLNSLFYFSGGTALSLYYLQHRESIDLDFFSQSQFDSAELLKSVTLWAGQLGCEVESIPVRQTFTFIFSFPSKKTVKVDFSYYPYQQVEKPRIIDGIQVDSVTDIAVNKLLVVEQRDEVKDFVDLYFLLKQFSVWDLLEGVRVKFNLKLDPYIIGSDFSKVEQFDYLPKMVKPLTLKQLKEFFIQKAQELAKRSVE